MPHLIIEHSADIKKTSVTNLEKEIQKIMHTHEGNFDADQCKCRSFSFDEYLVGIPDQSTASFIHITLKALSGRSVEVRKSLTEKIIKFTEEMIKNLNLSSKRCELSVEFVELERDTYQKIKIGN